MTDDDYLDQAWLNADYNGRPLYFDREGKPITFRGWAERRSSDAAVRVASTLVGKVWVSTVWLGMNHSFTGGPPLIFETMSFGDDDSELWDRYSTEPAALAGHDRVVAELAARYGVAPIHDLHPESS